ncbi:ATP-binding protein [Streptomyces alfalfae]
MSELVSTRIRNTAGKLGLPHLAETIREHTRRADEGKMGYLDFLDLVLSEELAVRDDRRFRQGLRPSKLPHHKTLDEYDFSFQPDLDPRKVKDLATLSFIEGKANAALLGPPGVGKTHIAVALAVAACRAGYSISFTSLDDMVRNLKAAETAGRLTNKLGTYRMNCDDKQLLRRRVYGADHGHPGLRPDRRYAELVGGPLDSLLLDITGWRPEEIDDGVSLLTELRQFGPGGRALYDPRPGDPGRFDWTGDTP